jgi:PPOX class probable F420-dependent enzyme
MTQADEALRTLVRERSQGVLATLKRDGRPQLSTITYVPDADLARLAVSVTDGRAKTANLRRDPRVSLHVASADGWSYAVVEGVAELSDVARRPDDATVDALVAYYRAANGEHPDWVDYRAAMVADRRLVLTIVVERLYGLARS